MNGSNKDGRKRVGNKGYKGMLPCYMSYMHYMDLHSTWGIPGFAGYYGRVEVISVSTLIGRIEVTVTTTAKPTTAKLPSAASKTPNLSVTLTIGRIEVINLTTGRIEVIPNVRAIPRAARSSSSITLVSRSDWRRRQSPLDRRIEP